MARVIMDRERRKCAELPRSPSHVLCSVFCVANPATPSPAQSSPQISPPVAMGEPQSLQSCGGGGAAAACRKWNLRLRIERGEITMPEHPMRIYLHLHLPCQRAFLGRVPLILQLEHQLISLVLVCSAGGSLEHEYRCCRQRRSYSQDIPKRPTPNWGRG
ncbi:hypothetical protein C8R47DRAFT_571225 [Mycena vitilis]|nr:hypothetical protein C8R47DRAFT_571225 [Mycena vitilis]